MNKDTERMYKAETGNTAIIEIESDYLIPQLDYRVLQENTKDEIIDILKYDSDHNADWGIFTKDIPDGYLDNSDLVIPTPEYVAWLESKLLELLKSKSFS